VNARASIRESSSGQQSGLSLDNVRRIGGVGVQKQSLPFHSLGEQSGARNISIKIDTAQEYHRDGPDHSEVGVAIYRKQHVVS
jgi:hypothetical protein